MSEKTVTKLTEDDMLKSFFNQHLEKYVMAKINKTLFGGMKADEVVGFQNIPTGPNTPPMRKEILAGEALEKASFEFDKQKQIVEVIRKLMESPKDY